MRIIFSFTVLFITITCSYGQTINSTIINLTNQWNNYISNHDTAKLSALYADTISYYGKANNKANVLLGKAAFFQKHTDFNQSINGKIEVTKITANQYKASFPKQSSFDGKTTEVKGYLIFSKKNASWKISVENDKTTYKNLTKNTIGTSIAGDFDGDGTIEKTTLQMYSKGKDEDEIDYFTINFSSAKIKPLKVSCDRDYLTLINEGDLNNIPGDEITVYSPPFGGCTFNMTTYTYVNEKWKPIMEPILVSTACDEMSDADLQKRIFKEGHTVYYLDQDLNDENWKLIKKKAKMK